MRDQSIIDLVRCHCRMHVQKLTLGLQNTAVLSCRVRKDHWKGMTETEKRAIADMQLQQMAEKQSRKQQELQEEAEYADLQARIGRSILQQAYQVGTPWSHLPVTSFSETAYGMLGCILAAGAPVEAHGRPQHDTKMHGTHC